MEFSKRRQRDWNQPFFAVHHLRASRPFDRLVEMEDMMLI